MSAAAVADARETADGEPSRLVKSPARAEPIAGIGAKKPPADSQEPVEVEMAEEVFATWAATSLILAVMGTQFSSRAGIKDGVRVPLDLVTMTAAALVLLWSALCYFGVLPRRYRAAILVFLLCYILGFFLFVVILVSTRHI
jgi:hypothetical protein